LGNPRGHTLRNSALLLSLGPYEFH
jgi:hypothetical protein